MTLVQAIKRAATINKRSNQQATIYKYKESPKGWEVMEGDAWNSGWIKAYATRSNNEKMIREQMTLKGEPDAKYFKK